MSGFQHFQNMCTI